MEVNRVSICKTCKQAFLEGETICPQCGEKLVISNCSTIYWNKCDGEKRSEIIRNCGKDTSEDKPTADSASASVYSSVTFTYSVGKIVKVTSVIILAVAIIGFLIELAMYGFGFGTLIFLMCLILGVISYGVGEICDVLTRMNSKM